MFSLSQRLQDISGFMTTTIFVMAVVISVVSIVQLNLSGYQSLPGDITVNDTHNSIRYSRNYGGKSGHGKENVKLRFDLDADLTPLFNWNTKQVFVYLVGEYDGPEKGDLKQSEEHSKVIFWDHIIPDASHAKLSLRNKKSKYSVYDYYPVLSNRTASVKLEFNVQPWVGPLIWGTLDATDEVRFHDPKSKN
ncbi:DEKNAAC102981 [Brettanomyces naardenensis]|uniref:Signal peptidase subunit 3 n=1 Tax=Brettanomyces naardenensis TaxID=13370 RepID=A0A448YM80_BRENA|nr:DEKNAAC102981 [Brettanomyces naardenensis]